MAQNDGASHYGSDGLNDRITTALAEAALLGRRLSPADLAPLDQFHTRGMAATVELAAAAHIAATDTVLDVGSGLGGPSRTLASTFGCSVTGIDLAPSFVKAAGMLSELAGLADLVRYRCADALAMPFADASFDVAWSQHVAMNIADRAGLYAEVHRVLKPGGRFATYDVVAGSGEPLHFPVPWSAGPDTSFLLRADAMRGILERQGFRVENWSDRTADAIAWVGQQRARAKVGAGGPTLGLHLAMGPEFPRMAANLGRNLLEGRVGIQQAVLVRP
jgi:SAM-dependent methyltransferase